MNFQLIEQAALVIPNKQQLVNVISKRVRQLIAGSRPMIEADLHMGVADIALSEIAAGKIAIIEESDALEEALA